MDPRARGSAFVATDASSWISRVAEPRSGRTTDSRPWLRWGALRYDPTMSVATPPTSTLPVTLDDVRAAADRIKGAVYRSPCPYSLALSRYCGAEIFCKLDHLQLTGSF